MKIRYMAAYRAIWILHRCRVYGIVFNLWEPWWNEDATPRWFGLLRDEDHNTLMLGPIAFIWTGEEHQP